MPAPASPTIVTMPPKCGSAASAEGAAEATILSPVVNIGDQEVHITGTKIVLSAGGGSITIDATGVTVKGTIVKIN